MYKFFLSIVLLVPSIVWADVEDNLEIKGDKVLTVQVAQALNFLEGIEPEDRPYIKFFTTYAMPDDYKQSAALALSFVCHSLSGLDNNSDILAGYNPIALKRGEKFIPIQQVSEDIWWIDIRDYNWTIEAWEQIAQEDGYFVEPAVDYDINSKFRIESGNSMVRADWFIVHATDITRQEDRNSKINIYNTLLYAKVEEPKTVDQFRTLWGLDLKKARKLGNEYGSLVLTSNKVALDNRVLMGYRTETGWLYETYDVKDDTGNRDYLETFAKNAGFPPKTSDAGEIFASNHLKMQVYALRDGEGNIVSFADPTVARHLNDVVGDARVRTGHSCMDCHAQGPLPAENIMSDYADWLNLKLPGKKNTLKVDRTFLDHEFEDSVV